MSLTRDAWRVSGVPLITGQTVLECLGLFEIELRKRLPQPGGTWKDIDRALTSFYWPAIVEALNDRLPLAELFRPSERQRSFLEEPPSRFVVPTTPNGPRRRGLDFVRGSQWVWGVDDGE